DCAAFVVEDIHVRAQKIHHLASLGHERFLVFEQRKYGALVRCYPWRESKDDPGLLLTLVIWRGVLVVSLANQSQHGAVNSSTGLDDMRDKFLFRFFVEVLER